MTRPLIHCVACLIVIAGGCVGTDFITDPTNGVSPKITITPSTHAILAGDSVSFQAMYFDSLGVERPASFVWSSANPTVASVTASGFVRGHLVGQANITAATSGGISKTARLSVVADASTQVASVVVTPDSIRLASGDTVRLSATAFSLNNLILPGVTFTWQSTHTAIATVNTGGLVIGIANGTTSIIATTNGVTSAPVKTVVGPINLRTGQFTSRPSGGYNVQGTAKLEKVSPSSDQLILKFGSDFNVSNGPGIEVFLSVSNSVTSGSLRLGPVKQLAGAQSYDIPIGVSLNTYNWVIIHCVPFNATFGYAQFQ